jgi:hypothetical protein
MAVSEEIQEKVLAEATSATPNYEIDYNDDRFGKVEADKNIALTELEQTYGGMIANSDKYFDEQIQASKDWADKQAQLQQEQTDFTIEQINQQKEQANKDYKKEQSGAYVDWRKQSNQYGTEAEKMASAGLMNTGYSESSQVSMYNTYQNRVATALESYNRAVLNYNNAIKDAQLQNNAALADIAYKALQQQLELSLQGFQYKNNLILEQANKKIELDNMYYNRYQDVLQQINTENAMAEDIRQYTETQKWNTEQAQLNRDWEAEQAQLGREFEAAQAEIERSFKSQEAELDRKFEAAQAELNRKHDKELLAVKNKYEKEQLEIQHKNDMAKLQKQLENEKALLNQKLANEKALLSHEYSLKQSQVTKSNNVVTKTKSIVDKIANTKMAGNTSFTGSSYKEAVAYMKKMGVPSSNASAAMTESEWSRRRTSYKMTGKGATEVKNYSSYSAYIRDYVNYCVETHAK